MAAAAGLVEEECWQHKVQQAKAGLHQLQLQFGTRLLRLAWQELTELQEPEAPPPTTQNEPKSQNSSPPSTTSPSSSLESVEVTLPSAEQEGVALSDALATHTNVFFSEEDSEVGPSNTTATITTTTTSFPPPPRLGGAAVEVRRLGGEVWARVARFGGHSVLAALLRACRSLYHTILTDPQLRCLYDEARLQHLWASPLRLSSVAGGSEVRYDKRLDVMRDNVKEIVATASGHLFVQIKNSQLWKAKYGPKLDQHTVITAVSSTFVYASSSLWEYAFVVPLVDAAAVVKPPQQQQQQPCSSLLDPSLEAGDGSDSNNSSGGSSSGSSTSSSILEFTTAQYRCEFRSESSPLLRVYPLSTSKLKPKPRPKPIATYSTKSGRFEFVSVEGDLCTAVFRSSGSLCELILLDLTSGETETYCLPPAVTFVPKVVKCCGGVPTVVAFELVQVSAYPLTRRRGHGGNGGNGGTCGFVVPPRVVLAAACAGFVGMTAECVLARSGEQQQQQSQQSQSTLHVLRLAEPDLFKALLASIPLTELLHKATAQVGTTTHPHPHQRPKAGSGTTTTTFCLMTYSHVLKQLVVYLGDGLYKQIHFLRQEPVLPPPPPSSATICSSVPVTTTTLPTLLKETTTAAAAAAAPPVFPIFCRSSKAGSVKGEGKQEEKEKDDKSSSHRVPLQPQPENQQQRRRLCSSKAAPATDSHPRKRKRGEGVASLESSMEEDVVVSGTTVSSRSKSRKVAVYIDSQEELTEICK